MNTDHRRFHSHSIHRFAAEATCERVIKPQKNSFWYRPRQQLGSYMLGFPGFPAHASFLSY